MREGSATVQVIHAGICLSTPNHTLVRCAHSRRYVATLLQALKASAFMVKPSDELLTLVASTRQCGLCHSKCEVVAAKSKAAGCNAVYITQGWCQLTKNAECIALVARLLKRLRRRPRWRAA